MFPIVPKAKPFPPCVTLDHVFAPVELDHLEKAAMAATDVAGTSNDRPVRRSKVRWLDFDQTNVWVYGRVAEIVGNINAEHYRFDLVGLGEPLQLARYEANEKGYYDYRREPYDARPNPTDGWFLDRKPANKSELIEYDFDTSPTLMVPGDWNSQDDRLFYYYQRVSAGVRLGPWHGFRLELAGGYTFDRFYFEGESFAEAGLTPDAIAQRFDEISDPSGAREISNGFAQADKLVASAQRILDRKVDRGRS